MNIQRFQNGQTALVQTQVRPLTGQVVDMPTTAVGDAIAGAGDAMARGFKMYQQSRDARQLVEAEQAMQAETINFAKWQQENPEESKWLPEWEKRTGALQGRFGKFNLSPEAQLSLERSVSRWSGSETMTIQNQAFKQSGARLRQAALNTLTQAEETGNEERGLAAISMAEQGHALFPEDAEAMRLDFSGKMKRKRQADAVATAQSFRQVGQFDQAAEVIRSSELPENEKQDRLRVLDHQREVDGLITIARDDPRRAAELAYAQEKAGKITGPERLQIVDTAERQMDENRATKLKAYTTEIQNGLADKEGFSAKVLEDSDLTPGDKAELARFMDAGPVNDPVVYQTMFNEARTFQYDEGSPEYARFLARVDMTQKEGNKSSILSRLDETIKGPKDGQTRAFNEVYSMLSDDLKNGVFGDFSTKLSDPAAVLPQNIRREIDAIKSGLMTDDESAKIKADPRRAEYLELKARNKWWDNLTSPDKGGSFNDYYVDDVVKRRNSANSMFQVTASLDKWRADNPKATPEQFKAEAERLTAQYRAAAGMKTGFVNPLLDGTQVPTRGQLDSEIAKFRRK